ncbi:hypothetical protein GCM10011571_13580 [Marinithermofilum abyssi]|uniref:Helix-turn-helix domain-containing protein n=1 Tax=Marinithermofilum abyssi TaxID=1571185 RepID=A0A8J2VI56_9BACL|nr:helix-turn-helix domain-containing protein [Marinithermofilum abyssi]GGE13415.1 hypothetical protein GCM10011571_13580 [Marinithermofilum abyssi]
MEKIQETYVVESQEQASCLLHPLRGEILSRLCSPASAAQVARSLNEPPQRINYHIKALEKANLVRRVGTRQVRNLVEVLYQAVARNYLLSDTLGWGADTVQKLKDQSSLRHVYTTAERLKRDALRLMEQTEAGQEIPSATLDAVIQLADENHREAFVQDYIRLMKQLIQKYQKKKQVNHLTIPIKCV